MSAPSLFELVHPDTPDEILADELTIGADVGLPVTAWQPLGVAIGLLQINSVLASTSTQTVANIAQGGYATYAAQMVDANGSPVTSWMDLISEQNYNLSRIAPTFAQGDNTTAHFTNVSGQSYGPFTPGQVLVSNPTTGAVYQNSATITIAASTTTGVALVAQVAGSSGTSGPGQITNMVTPKVGVSITNTTMLIGADAETNGALLKRDQSKLGSLSPNGAPQAYYFVATSILDPLQPFYNPALSKTITRVFTETAPAFVQVFIANVGGPVSSPDVAIVNTAIQQWCVPLGTTAVVASVGSITIPITYTAYVPSTAGLTAPQVELLISDALVAYFDNLPIGGIEDGSGNHVVPWSKLVAVIGSASVAINAVELLSPSTDTSLAITDVALLGSITPTVVFTP